MLNSLTVVAISDTHGMHQQITVPDADVLIHSGDFCRYGQMDEVADFAKWLMDQPHEHKIVVPGNHDKPVEQHTAECRTLFEAAGAHLLINEEITIDDIKFWGSPFTPQFFDWSFMKGRGAAIAEIWAQIPEDVDVLITHGPPYGHGGLVPSLHPREAGCLDLLIRLRELANATGGCNPQFHVFGHIHEGYGVSRSDEFPTLRFINASICTGKYRPTNQPISFGMRRN